MFFVQIMILRVLRLIALRNILDVFRHLTENLTEDCDAAVSAIQAVDSPTKAYEHE